MPNPSHRRSFRRFVFRLHTWLGLHFCLVLGVIFFTGVLLLYSPELTFARHHALWISPQSASEEQTVTVGRIYDTVAQERPGSTINMVASQARPWFGRPAYGWDQRGGFTAYVSPYSGAFIGYFNKGRLPLRDLVRKLHDSLLVPFYSMQIVVNALSFVGLTLVITGLITYRRFWKGFLRLPQKGADRRARSGALHRVTAVWVAPFLLASMIGSAVFFFNSVGLKAVPGAAPAVVSERAERLPDGFNGAALDEMLAGCRAELPTFVEKVTQLPGTNAELVRFNGYDTAVGSVFGAATCYADPANRQVAGIVRAADGNWMVQIKALAIAVHFGTWAGWYSIALWTVFGAGSVYLALTGARVFAARIIAQRGHESGGVRRSNTLAIVVDGLGIFKWAYFALVAGVVVLTLV